MIKKNNSHSIKHFLTGIRHFICNLCLGILLLILLIIYVPIYLVRKSLYMRRHFSKDPNMREP